MKRLIYISAILFYSVLFAEEVPNLTETDCNDDTMSVFRALENNKPLFVIASGYDCSICKSEAPGYAVLADSLVGRVSVWGAMNYRFSSTKVPSCTELNSWKNSYDWDNFFMFNDNNNGTNKTWAQGGYTSYTVVNPMTKEYAYRGTSENRALDSLFAILERAETITSTSNVSLTSVDFNYFDGLVTLSEPATNASFEVYTLNGQLLSTDVFSGTSFSLDVTLPDDQLLILKVKTAKGSITKKISL